MKTKWPINSWFRAIQLAWLAWPLAAMAGDGTNVLKNPGFEEETKVSSEAFRKAAAVLIEHGVRLPAGDPVVMPAEVYVNPDDGWKLVKSEAAFAYVQGQPGAEVHTGRRAIHIVSPNVSVGTAVGGQVDVVEGFALDEKAVQIDTACLVTFYAKGAATVGVEAYLYDRGHQGVYGQRHADSLKVEPVTIQVDDQNQWKAYRATLKITNPDVTSILFVLHVKGEVAIDDVTFQPK
ncbi:MAG: hypothetical protein A3K19_05375 [Lentisphaerae bacterium RIFOXYB12_FULL_65_16]|nr:MAG: hypothetical protein A3K18_15845 [Lentisphaerae bacterium RIFOXYA12_64_32]OGV94322.1 MAG: hypothetical protein A3K19_05375 [Lentisphaerae bacterium RIFOXYB12_FULL_65_16]